jgi:hypothetical protein
MRMKYLSAAFLFYYLGRRTDGVLLMIMVLRVAALKF